MEVNEHDQSNNEIEDVGPNKLGPVDNVNDQSQRSYNGFHCQQLP